jgi:hypothetical protein
MKIFKIRDFYQKEYQEYIIGSKEIERHSVYFVYGEVPVNGIREMGAPEGHEEILFLLSGEAILENRGVKTQFIKEQAVFMANESFTFTALTECRYVVAGAHTMAHHH